MIDYLHKGRPVEIMAERFHYMYGYYAQIQQTKPCGCMYRIKERPIGFKQYELVKFSELTEVDHAVLD